ncbi:lysylphosphatidylglycerol synthase domain-containing protein [Cupriavidus pauculus]|uniref:lysylphosphatidylglycerol synthase domain-containing protein n=1 Tax=Cupriavidus pauculus TaxID=82633 RepID=UPI001EE27E5A|nr:lysylphosphatidylglycerol synthase domain-containing protein [Cupriavidus pauculus]GJG97962.1 UPF0104 family protein [Cupriavidus pauculus]
MTTAANLRRNLQRNIRWPVVKRIAGLVFVVLVAYLIYRSLSGVDWAQVLQALKRYDAATLLPVLGLACVSFCLHASFDILGRRYTGHHLSTPRVMLIAFIAYVFNLNVGAMVGGLGMRLRLYSRANVSGSQVAGIYTIAIITNWTGYMMLAGGVLTAMPPMLPADWGITPWMLRGLGVLMLAGGLLYWLACARAKTRSVRFGRHVFRLPGFRFALLQSLLSMTNWIVLACIIDLLLPKEVRLAQALTALLVGAVAGALAHIPAGIGVLESVFVVLLRPVAPEHVVVAALIAYRALYYLLPMAIATSAYAWMELRGTRRQRRALAERAPPAS